MSDLQQRRANLKVAVVEYLNTCKKKRSKKHDFWNNVSKYCKESLQRTKFGVSSLNALFIKFRDVIRIDEKYVYLINQEEPSEGNLDEDVDDDWPSLQASNSVVPPSSQAQSAHQRYGIKPGADNKPGLSVKSPPVAGSKDEALSISPSPRQLLPQGQTQRLSSSQSQLHFQDQTLMFQPPQTMVHPSKNIQQFPPQNIQLRPPQNIQFSPQNIQQFPPQNIQHRPPENIQHRPPNIHPQLAPAMVLVHQQQIQVPAQRPMLQSVPSRPNVQEKITSVTRQATQAPMQPPLVPLPFQVFSNSSLQQAQMAALGPLLQAAPPPLPSSPPESMISEVPISASTSSEWPRSSPKSGLPPGTKLENKVKECVVKPISLPPGTRLTTEQVDYQVQDCIDVLCEANEHVSMERIENMLLWKYQVKTFKELRLHEKYIDLLPRAKEHNMQLGRVNAYAQSFVRSRSLCTLYELKECLRDFHPEKKDFDHLKLGPLQKMPVVYDLFKFPMDEYIPEITVIDLYENLHQFLDRNNCWTKPVKLSEFIQFLEKSYNVSDSLSLGIRIRSIPLAIQMLKKSKRDEGASRKKTLVEMQSYLRRDLQEAFERFRASILQSSQEGSLELRRHYLNLSPEDTIRDITAKFELLAEVLTADTSQATKLQRVLKYFHHFLKNVLEVPAMRMLYHLSVCLSNLQVQESAVQYFEQKTKQQQQQLALQVEKNLEQQRKSPPTKVGLTEKLLTYLNRCLESGSLLLSHLAKIESKTVTDFGFTSFKEMGYGHFLDYLLAESKLKLLLEEAGGTMIGSSSRGQEAESVYKPSQLELLEFICQVKQSGIAQSQLMEKMLREQFYTTDVRHFSHSNVSRLCAAADRPGKHAAKEHHVHFEVSLCGKQCATPHDCGQVGIQGSQNKEAAMACLTNCPLLEDMMEWSHWSLVFEPQLGSFRTFIQKHGGYQQITLAGGHGTAVSDFMALEVEPGKFLKVVSQATQEDFFSALDSGDPIRTAGYLVSLIVANRGLENTPLALLANHVKTCLIGLHAHSPNVSVPGGPPPSYDFQTVNLAVQFVTAILLRLPARVCAAIANQVLLEPLSSVMGSANSKREIAQLCQLPGHQQRLELLGCLLGLPEWTTSLQQKCHFLASHLVEDITDEDLLEQEDFLPKQTEVESESEECQESDNESLLSDTDHDHLSDADQGHLSDTNLLLPEVDDKAQKSSSSIDDDHQCRTNEMENKETPLTKEDDLLVPQADQNTETEEIHVNSEELMINTETPLTSDQNAAISEQQSSSEAEVAASQHDPATSQEIPAVEEARELSREEICQLLVETIQKEEFGLGIQLDETGEKLMKKQQERQGRSLQRLSKDLYSKETHFVLELIQNADDNSYSEDSVPAVKFVIDASGVTVLNNELGFEENNIRALCDVGKSTKEKQRSGYIGQKGIGFKSVFRVTGRPEVHSNGFHVCFDVESGPMGYILPHWITDPIEDKSWQTRIVLPWTEEIKKQVRTHASRFNDIQPSLLLFLRRLKKITIDNKVEGFVMAMKRKDLSDTEVQIKHSNGTDRWLVLRKILETSGVSVKMKSGVEVESTEIALAFPLRSSTALNSQVKPEKLPVFAFLPLRSYGFRFIVQGDFDVPSSREDVDRDSSWNQWLRSAIPGLFVEALETFKAHPELSRLKALIAYLQFVPLEGEVMDFFKPVVTQILAQLRAKECMPVLTGDKQNLLWKMPSKTVIAKDSLVLEIISPELLQHHLGLYYLHPEVAAILEDPLVQALGIETVSTENLLHIGQSMGVDWGDKGTAEQISKLARWFACVYRSLDDFQENTQVMEKLCSLRIIPLSKGSLVAFSDVTVFLLMDDEADTNTKTKKKGIRDPILELKKDLNLVHSDLTNTGDDEINSQVVKLLLRMGVKQMNAHDLIHSHILPVLKSDDWQTKKREVLVSYLVYIKAELDKNPSVIDMSELRPVARLVTNHGIKTPMVDDVHFTTAFGNKIDLSKKFPGYDWTLVDSAYLPHTPSQHNLASWHHFLSELGVVDFLRVKMIKVQFSKDEMHETAWATFKDVWPDSPDGYTVLDYQCEEFHKLVTANQKTDQIQMYNQMQALFEMLDKEWDSKYKRCTHTQLKSSSGHLIKEDIQSSFAVYLETLSWVPCLVQSLDVLDDGERATCQAKYELSRAAGLYIRDPSIEDLLAHTVKYLTVGPPKTSSFIKDLKIKTSIKASMMKESLISWCRREPDSPDLPRRFCTTLAHIYKVYRYMVENLSNKEAQDLFHNHPVIFVPVLENHSATSLIKTTDVLVGAMLRREEVWWCDPTQLFTKYRSSLLLYKSTLIKRKYVSSWYMHEEFRNLFLHIARIEHEPDTFDLAQLLKHLASVETATEPDILRDALFLFSKIGFDLSSSAHTEGGVKTQQAMKADLLRPKVVNLLSKSAIFPTKQGQWVSLTDNPMIADSTELEDIFGPKPGVHLLQLQFQDKSKARGRNIHERGSTSDIDENSLRYFLSLFEEIRPLSECVKTEEITSMFQQCVRGQQFMHGIVGLVQRFLYFYYPDVYDLVKEKKAATLKELLFCQVAKLEMRYELSNRPNVYEIRSQNCVIQGKHFYFHEQYLNNQSDIIREVAKYFSEGNERCMKNLRSFLTQVVPILDGKSDETLDGFLSREFSPNQIIPAEEEIWEIPLPIIHVEPKPEPVPETLEEQTQSAVYGRALSVTDGEKSDTANVEEEAPEIKSWPPNSHLFKEHQDKAKRSDGAVLPGIWPPPKGMGYDKLSKMMPSSIKFEKTEEPTAEDGVDKTTENERKTSKSGNSQVFVRSSSHSDEYKSTKGGSASGVKGVNQGQSISRQSSSKESTQDQTGKAPDKGVSQHTVERQTSTSSSAGQGKAGHGLKSGTEAVSSSADGKDDPGDAGLEKKQTEAATRVKKKRNKNKASKDSGPQDNAGKESRKPQEQDLVATLTRQEEAGELTPSGPGAEGGTDGAEIQEPDHQDVPESSSSREVTPSTSGSSMSNRKTNWKGTLHFTIPVWTESSENVAYTDLSSVSALSVPEIDINEESAPEEIGRWGEQLVWDYLKNQAQSDGAISEVVWMNADSEVGCPYDFEVIYNTGRSEVSLKRYIEVKATVSVDKSVFKVSSNQIEFALQQKDQYEIYRVFGAGQSRPRLMRVENVAERMRTHAVKLFMVL